MMTRLRGETITYLAYVGFLVGFIGLGLFVYALAAGSAVAGIIGAALVISDLATVVLFRLGARKRAAENDSGIEIPGVNIFATPLEQEQIDNYLLTYRGERSRANTAPRGRVVAVSAGAPASREDERLAA
ncbi:hypothetical protein AU195_14440 [Mycobacterium sp. IS-1496]|uniref:hypothetical protein n=1 Tax=Mycobacterium sp. IS-1496 TaxID=1772284 RepID=UPI0007417BBF|nr:hypothetical protein [Mycobacterium sp. IS-1496]KUI26188.1 hypothetical protein AU195_14440 [Mycobacterium sp. IS-1496]